MNKQELELKIIKLLREYEEKNPSHHVKDIYIDTVLIRDFEGNLFPETSNISTLIEVLK